MNVKLIFVYINYNVHFIQHGIVHVLCTKSNACLCTCVQCTYMYRVLMYQKCRYICNI